MMESLARTALLEDLSNVDDVTSDAPIPADITTSLTLTARHPGVSAGLDVAALVFCLADPTINIEFLIQDGSDVEAGEPLAKVHGPAPDPRSLPARSRSTCQDSDPAGQHQRSIGMPTMLPHSVQDPS